MLHSITILKKYCLFHFYQNKTMSQRSKNNQALEDRLNNLLT